MSDWKCVASFLAVKELPWAAINHCPWCKCKSPNIQPGSSTMLGGGDGTHRGDPNHRWDRGSCRKCKKKFMRETKMGSVWFTGLDTEFWAHGDGKVIAGLPNCFEYYEVPCKCGGKVVRKYYETDGVTPNTSGLLSYSFGVGELSGPNYRTLMECDTCLLRIEAKT